MRTLVWKLVMQYQLQGLWGDGRYGYKKKAQTSPSARAELISVVPKYSVFINCYHVQENKANYWFNI